MIPSSKLKRELARILKEQGYIEAYEIRPAGAGPARRADRRSAQVHRDRQPVISGLQRVSRPGQRTYVDHAHIPRVQGGMGTAIISTSSGVMTGHEARQQGVGGEVVAKVW